MDSRIYVTKVETLVCRLDGRVAEYAAPVACDCCGRVCTAKVAHMSDGSRLGADCALVVERVSGQAVYGRAADEFALLGGNRRQRAYLTALGAL